MSWSLKAAIATVVGVFSLWALSRAAKAAPSSGPPSVPLGPLMDAEQARKLTPDWTTEDFRMLVEIAGKYKMSPADLWLVLVSESGGKPGAVNRRASDGFPVAVGLNQLTSSANALVGLTEEERAQVPTWSVYQQLPLVDKFFAGLPWTKAGREYSHAGLIYEGNFAPSIMMSRGTSPDTVLYQRGKDGIFYDRNSGFDVAKKGTITVGDLIEHLRLVVGQPTYRAGLQRLREITGDQGLAPQLPMR